MEAFELRLWDGRIGRWLSPDPYGEFHSPYLGMGNNPINIIDIDGGRIYVTNKDKITYEYRDGNLYDKNGNIYNNGDDDFLNATKTALTKLDLATSSLTINDGKLERRGIINDLVKSNDIYRIVYGKDSHSARAKISIDHKAIVKTPTTSGIIKSTYEITLAHEIGHLFSLNKGFKDESTWFEFNNKPVSRDEIFAVHWENMFRGALNLPLRTHYAIFDGKAYGESKINIDDSGKN